MEVRLNPALQGFRCLRCEASFPIGDFFEGCPVCAQEGHAASVVASYASVSNNAGSNKAGSNNAGSNDGKATPRHRLPLLGTPDLGQGDTPLLTLPGITEELEMEGIWLKAEGQNPTGSHKDRMSSLVVARAKMLGHSRVLAASSGNAGVSLAAYAARAGIDCTILTRSGLTGTWSRDIVEHGADLLVLDTGPERWVRMGEMVREGEGYPATNYRTPPVGSNPWGVQGYKTLGHELGEALSATPPDVVLVPTARGDLLWGVWEGLCEVGAASSGSNPFEHTKMVAVEPFRRAADVLAGADYRGTFPGTSDQAAIASTTVTWQTIHTLRASKGTAVEVDDREVADARNELVRQGIALERCSAGPLVALRKLRATGALPAGSRAVLVASSDGRREDP